MVSFKLLIAKNWMYLVFVKIISLHFIIYDNIYNVCDITGRVEFSILKIYKVKNTTNKYEAKVLKSND